MLKGVKRRAYGTVRTCDKSLHVGILSTIKVHTEQVQTLNQAFHFCCCAANRIQYFQLKSSDQLHAFLHLPRVTLFKNTFPLRVRCPQLHRYDSLYSLTVPSQNPIGLLPNGFISITNLATALCATVFYHVVFVKNFAE